MMAVRRTNSLRRLFRRASSKLRRRRSSASMIQGSALDDLERSLTLVLQLCSHLRISFRDAKLDITAIEEEDGTFYNWEVEAPHIWPILKLVSSLLASAEAVSHIQLELLEQSQEFAVDAILRTLFLKGGDSDEITSRIVQFNFEPQYPTSGQRRSAYALQHIPHGKLALKIIIAFHVEVHPLTQVYMISRLVNLEAIFIECRGRAFLDLPPTRLRWLPKTLRVFHIVGCNWEALRAEDVEIIGQQLCRLPDLKEVMFGNAGREPLPPRMSDPLLARLLENESITHLNLECAQLGASGIRTLSDKVVRNNNHTLQHFAIDWDNTSLEGDPLLEVALIADIARQLHVSSWTLQPFPLELILNDFFLQLGRYHPLYHDEAFINVAVWPYLLKHALKQPNNVSKALVWYMLTRRPDVLMKVSNR